MDTTDSAIDCPKPIGGWLVLIIIVLANEVWRSLYNSLMTLAASLSVLRSFGGWILNEYLPGAQWFGSTTMFTGLLMGVFGVFVLKLLLATDTRAPKWLMRFLLIYAFVDAATLASFWIADVPTTNILLKLKKIYILSISKDVVACLVIFFYLRYSKRVKSTFVLR